MIGRRLRPAWLLPALAAAMAIGSGPATAQSNPLAVKAAFIPKFARYVEWPAGTLPADSAPYQLCVVGHDPFGTLLDLAAARESVRGHRITVRRMPTAEGSVACHLAFVQGASAESTAQLLAALESRPVLTITDARNGSARGMIHFTQVGRRVRFFIDEARAVEHGLSISSRLLSLALGVRQRRT